MKSIGFSFEKTNEPEIYSIPTLFLENGVSDMAPYEQLLTRLQRNQALNQVGMHLSWDQEVMMPPAGAEARAEQAAALEAVTHQQWTDPKLLELIEILQTQDLPPIEAANIRLARREVHNRTRVPAGLATQLARLTSRAQQAWAKARADRDFAVFAPELKQIIDLKRQEADCLRENGSSRYDALLDQFEPGMTTAVLGPLLEGMRPRLSALRSDIAEKSAAQPALSGSFDTVEQMKLSRLISETLGFDFRAGRLDLSIHPFSSGTATDVRITTRLAEDSPLDCLYSTIHELGHALYEQGLPRDMSLTPAGQHVSMGVHESQSRLWENQIGRGKAFCTWLHPIFTAHFPDSGADSVETLYRIVNRVETGFIRTEADEVHYNLHILLRFELERELIAGELEVEDLEKEWNRRFERDFGLAVPHAACGVLQDIHWSAGLFGYFPTYALGNIYAAQLFDQMKQDIGTQDENVAAGDTQPVLEWLRDKIHGKGSISGPAELVESVVGTPVSSQPLLDYLEGKFRPMFSL